MESEFIKISTKHQHEAHMLGHVPVSGDFSWDIKTAGIYQDNQELERRGLLPDLRLEGNNEDSDEPLTHQHVENIHNRRYSHQLESTFTNQN